MSAPTPRGRKRQRDAPAHLPAPKNRNGFAFDGSYPDLYDIVLVVEGKKFYVNKKQLSLHSRFFHRLFYGGFEEAKKEEIEIKEVSADEFQNFLEVAHGVKDLENSTVEAVFDLSDRFDCEHIVKKCKKFLMAHNKVPLQTMLALSIRHNLEELKKKAIGLVKNKWDMKAILPADLKELDHPTMSLLLKKSLELSANASINAPSRDERDAHQVLHDLYQTAPKMKNVIAFEESDPDLYDIVLVVEEKKFYVNKMQLALHSKFFHRMFYGEFEEAKKEEIEIKEVSADEFQNFLEVAHGVEDLENSTVEAVFDLSDRFDCEHIVKKCKKFLMAHNKVPLQTMLALSIRHNLEELKKKAIGLVKTKWDMEAILPADIKELDHLTMSLLLKKSLELSAKASINAPSNDERDAHQVLHDLYQTAPKMKNAIAFDESDPDLYDIVLVVKEKKFYVNKMQLALHSKFFYRMFYGEFDEAKKEEIKIKEVSVDDFQKFLEVVHGLEDLEVFTVEAVFDLSDRFDCQHIIKRCKKFLLANNEVPTETMLALAARYHIEELKTKALEMIKVQEASRRKKEEKRRDLIYRTWASLSGFAYH